MSDHALRVGDIIRLANGRYRCMRATDCCATVVPVSVKPVIIVDRLKGTTRTFRPTGRAIHVSTIVGKTSVVSAGQI